MYTKVKRITTWVLLSFSCIAGSAGVSLLGEFLLAGSRFHQIATILFACGVGIGISGILIAFISLAINDWNEGKITKQFVSFEDDDNILSINRHKASTVFMPINGKAKGGQISPSKEEALYVSKSSIEHVHYSHPAPEIKIMDDDLYEDFFKKPNY